MKTTIRILLGLAVMMLPALAFAGVINPPGGNAWDLFTTGNGPALSQALTAIKLILASGSFRALFLLTATIAFVVMAVRAGMDFGKNGWKFVLFFILIGFLNLGMKTYTVNLNIDDPLSTQMSADTGKYGSPTVTGVPAIVGWPAALISSVGHWLTQEFETALSIPGELSLTNGGGTFNIFGKMLADADKFVITNPGLKKSLSAYISDCAIPAMAYGKINSNDLLTSQDLFATLANAGSNAIMTRYYPGDSSEVVKKSDGSSYPTCAPGSYVQGHSGALMSCTQAYSCIQQDLDKHAQMIENAAAKSWQDAGVMTPFEEEFKTVLSWASGALDVGTDGGTISPGGLIKQKAMIAALSGSFRDAAAQTGNNSLLTDAAITQAEQSQVSGWATSTAIFNNTMGFVVTTLQTFIYVLVPLILVALLIPGFGRKIGANYVQFLFWLALLEPTFAVVNFVIALYGQEHVSSALAQHGGWTAGGAWAVSSTVNKLNLAASVLGTSVPLIVWGLVKGSMAITEFIAHGMSASFGAQAGAAAASGSFSMGNVQMDNISTSKYNTASSISVGDQATHAFQGVGSGATTYEQGGVGTTANTKPVTRSLAHGSTQNDNAQKTHQSSQTKGYNKTTSGSHGWSGQYANQAQAVSSHLTQKQRAKVAQDMHAYNVTAQDVSQFMHDLNHTEGASANSGKGYKGGINPSVGGAGGGGSSLSPEKRAAVQNFLTAAAKDTGLNFSTDANGNVTVSMAGNTKDSTGETFTLNTAGAHNRSSGTSGSDGTTLGVGNNQSSGSQAIYSFMGSMVQQATDSGSLTDSYVNTLSDQQSWGNNSAYPLGVTPMSLDPSSLASPMTRSGIMAGQQAQENAIGKGRGGAFAEHNANEGDATRIWNVDSQSVANLGAVPSIDPHAQDGAVNGLTSDVAGRIGAANVDVGAAVHALDQKASDSMSPSGILEGKFPIPGSFNPSTGTFGMSYGMPGAVAGAGLTAGFSLAGTGAQAYGALKGAKTASALAGAGEAAVAGESAVAAAGASGLAGWIPGVGAALMLFNPTHMDGSTLEDNRARMALQGLNPNGTPLGSPQANNTVGPSFGASVPSQAPLLGFSPTQRQTLSFNNPMLNDYAHRVEREYNLPPGLLNAVKNAGERSNPWQTSSAGASGVMQFMPATWKKFGSGDPRDPVNAINAAGKYFHSMLEHYNGNIDAAIAEYNGGTAQGAAVAAGGKAWATETKNYLGRIHHFAAKHKLGWY